MSKTYEVIITETRERTKVVEAKEIVEAELKADEEYWSGKVDLDDDRFIVKTEFQADLLNK